MSPQFARRSVVITGIGVVSPNGIGAETYAAACRDGISGIRAPHDLDLQDLRTSAVGQVRGFDVASVIGNIDARRVPRMVALALQASREALADAELPTVVEDIDVARQIGVVLGTGGGGVAFVEETYRHWFLDGRASPFSVTAGTHGNLSSELSIALGIRGPSHVISTGCTSSTDAIGYATMLIRNGVVPMMLVGGSDAPIATGVLAAFEKMKVISTKAWPDASQSSRPFSIDRDGFVLSEGSWMFILEDREHAEARGVTMLAEIAGYGSTCDAYHRVQIAPEVVEPVRAMNTALDDAGLSVGAVDYVNLHGTSTALNDKLETLALKKCLGARARSVPMSSTKSMIGHPQGACGAAGLAATVMLMRQGVVHPTINLDTPDPDCDLDYVPKVAREALVNVALCNCIAFGSKNSALVIKRIGSAVSEKHVDNAPLFQAE